KYIPSYLLYNKHNIIKLNNTYIYTTKDFFISYKLNIAFYKVMCVRGWEALEKTLDYIPDTHFTIADAKRGDIGSSSSQYAKTFFETYNFDAITVAPYMGEDSIRPFLDYNDKFTIVLGLTSNKGARDFELLKTSENEY